MIGDRVIEFSDLQQLSGQTQRAAVERWARAQGIPFLRNRDGICTTLDALNLALGIPHPAASPTPRRRPHLSTTAEL